MNRFEIATGRVSPQTIKYTTTDGESVRDAYPIEIPGLKEELNMFFELYIGFKNTAEISLEIRNFILECIKKHINGHSKKLYPSAEHLKIEVKASGLNIEVKALNLYTFLILNGLLVPYELTKEPLFDPHNLGIDPNLFSIENYK